MKRQSALSIRPTQRGRPSERCHARVRWPSRAASHARLTRATRAFAAGAIVRAPYWILWREVSDLAVVDVVGSELEAILVCAVLRDAGVMCMHRVTNLGSGAMDGLTTGGPRAIVVRPEHLDLARRVIREQRDVPRPSSGRSISTVSTPPLPHAAATRSSPTLMFPGASMRWRARSARPRGRTSAAGTS